MKVKIQKGLITRIYGPFLKYYVISSRKGQQYLRKRFTESCSTPEQKRIREAFLLADIASRGLDRKLKQYWQREALAKKKKNWYCYFMSVNIKRLLRGEGIIYLPPLIELKGG
jgi:hypothetical protein